MSNTFANVFQTAVSDASLVTYTAEQLAQAFNEATLHQFPLVPAKVKALLKDVVKDGLLFAPVIAQILETGGTMLVSGRHREHVARTICADYGINATGKTVLRTPENEGMLQPIALEMQVSVISVPDTKTALRLVVAANGSRTMSAPEQAKIKITMGTGTPSLLFQDKMSALLSAGVAEQNSMLADNVLPVSLTAVTALSMCKMCTAQIKILVHATDAQITEFIDGLVNHLFLSDLPDNLARDFRPVIAEFLGEIVGVEYDAGGEEVEVRYADQVARSIVKPAPKARAKKATGVDKDATIAALMAQLSALGVTA